MAVRIQHVRAGQGRGGLGGWGRGSCKGDCPWGWGRRVGKDRQSSAGWLAVRFYHVRAEPECVGLPGGWRAAHEHGAGVAWVCEGTSGLGDTALEGEGGVGLAVLLQYMSMELGPRGRGTVGVVGQDRAGQASACKAAADMGCLGIHGYCRTQCVVRAPPFAAPTAAACSPLHRTPQYWSASFCLTHTNALCRTRCAVRPLPCPQLQGRLRAHPAHWRHRLLWGRRGTPGGGHGGAVRGVGHWAAHWPLRRIGQGACGWEMSSG